MMISTLSLLLLSSLGAVSAMPGNDALSGYSCQPGPKPYLVPDPRQCDRFAICAENKKSIRLCKDGFALDLSKGQCDLLSKVDCESRPQLQESTSTNPACPRANGLYEIEGVCDEYVDCRQSVDYPRQCSVGTVFDAKAASCVHVDDTSREDCLASRILDFECPETDARTKFVHGNHNRFADPEDCSKYFICRANGQPRQFTCKYPDVFDKEKGVCVHYKGVEGCKDHYETAELGNNRLKVVLVTDI